jgi:uncharacterized protein (TIGR00375 family)
MKFIADLHVHSKFSRATAKNLDLENLYIAAQLKGVTVVGTGDFTYPGWFSEICEKLEPAESGLFKLRKDLAKTCDEQVPQSCRADVRFVLSTEISNIYKKNNKTRKNHNLILVPDLQVAENFSAKLDNIGNIKSDGRPILGLDARDLLEILLETSDEAFLIPAHIWTPWFSVLGSKSGFDSIEECFEDLTPQIFAVETGLSSDPPMNWRVSQLDGLTLVSNSDAHSPLNLGREANLLNTQLSYPAIKSAIQTGDTNVFPGTFEFYPQEGKYHLDGHRKCNIRLQPWETMKYDGKCPVCGKELTMGVLYRVEELADRRQGIKPENCHSFYSIVQLSDILSEIFQVGSKSKKVLKNYQSALDLLGSEFSILHFLNTDVIDRAGIPLLGEAIQRVRDNEIEIFAGYDGEYGKVKIFKTNERERLMGQKALFTIPATPPIQLEHIESSASSSPNHLHVKPVEGSKKSETEPQMDHQPNISVSQLNRQQREAVEYPGGPLLIIAGPGTGKTRTLTQRIACLILEKGVLPQHVLAVTFTNKAAEEMRERLNALLVNPPVLPLVATFHSFCFKILNEQKHKPTGILDDDQRRGLVSEAINHLEAAGEQINLKPKEILQCIISAKQQILSPDELVRLNSRDSNSKIITDIYRVYQRLLSIQGFCDYEDLLFNVVRLFESNASQCRKYQEKFQHIFVDEYQDLNHPQYRIIRALAPTNNSVKDLCVIGDPDQAIYGFRGSDIKYFKRFITDYPGAKEICLTRNYRSTQTILDASFQVIQDHRLQSTDLRVYSQKDGPKAISVLELTTEKAEADAIAKIIEQQIGGTGFHSIDTGTVKDANLSKALSYSDFAVLYRTNDQHRVLAEIFEKSGIPFQIASRENALKQAGLPELVSFLKVVEDKGGFWDYETIIPYVTPGIGKKTLDQFKNWCYQNGFSLPEGLIKAGRFPIPGLQTSRQQQLNDFSDQISRLRKEMLQLTVAEKLLYLEKNTRVYSLLKNDSQVREKLADLVELARRFDFDTTEFFAATALHTDTDTYTPRVEKVSLMTMHAAKGLEFPVVFITGCEEDFIPYKRGGTAHVDIKEERRLFYVAMTRAMERIYLTRAKKRRIYGRIEDRILSSFVADIENRLKRDATPASGKKNKDPKQVQLKLFS